MAQTPQKYCEGQHSYLPFMFNSLTGWVACELTICHPLDKAVVSTVHTRCPVEKRGDVRRAAGEPTF